MDDACLCFFCMFEANKNFKKVYSIYTAYILHLYAATSKKKKKGSNNITLSIKLYINIISH